MGIVVCGRSGVINVSTVKVRAAKAGAQDHSPGQETLAQPEDASGAHFLPVDPEESSSPDPHASTRFVLVVEDNRADVFLVERAVEFYRVPVRMMVMDDGEQAVKYLESAETGEAPCPDLVLLDLNLPKRTGSEALRHWRASVRCGSVPIIVFTSSDSAEDRRMAAKPGVTRYFRKPMKYEEFLKIGEVMNEVLAAHGGAAQG